MLKLESFLFRRRATIVSMYPRSVRISTKIRSVYLPMQQKLISKRYLCHSGIDIYRTLRTCCRSGRSLGQISRRNGSRYPHPCRRCKWRHVSPICHTIREIRFRNPASKEHQYVPTLAVTGFLTPKVWTQVWSCVCWLRMDYFP